MMISGERKREIKFVHEWLHIQVPTRVSQVNVIQFLCSCETGVADLEKAIADAEAKVIP